MRGDEARGLQSGVLQGVDAAPQVGQVVGPTAVRVMPESVRADIVPAHAGERLRGICKAGGAQVVTEGLRAAFGDRHRAIEIELGPTDDPMVGDFTSAMVDRDALDEALRRLDAENRAIVVMHYYLGMPMPEIARSLGIPLGTTKSRLHRSIRAMRLTIAPDERSTPSPIPGGQLA
jgi:hypothetical protein